MTPATRQKIAKIEKSIELQRRIRKNVEESRVHIEGVDGLDVERMLHQCDEMILTLEVRRDDIARRAEWPTATKPVKA